MKELDPATDGSDTLLVAWVVLVLLEQLQRHTPAKVPDLTSFKMQLEAAFVKLGLNPK